LFVRRLFLQKIDAHKLPESIAVVNGILNAFVRQIEPALQQIHPQHLFDSLRWAAALAAEIMRLDEVDPLVPRDYFIHDVQKFFPLRCPFPHAVFHIAEALLTHSATACAFSSILSYSRDFVRLNQWFPTFLIQDKFLCHVFVIVTNLPFL
jgi:hypothetical protein